ncbi:hypothetical protein D3C78_1790490 [compost metagenome]
MRQVALQAEQLLLVLQVLGEQRQRLPFGGLCKLVADVGLQALDALGQRLFAEGAQEVVEDAPDVFADQQVAGAVEAEPAIHLGAGQ